MKYVYVRLKNCGDSPILRFRSSPSFDRRRRASSLGRDRGGTHQKHRRHRSRRPKEEKRRARDERRAQKDRRRSRSREERRKVIERVNSL